jgi:hypothetical protein
MGLKITQQELHSIELASVRKDRVAQGYFDGRFKTKTVKSKKAYSRKAKHKNLKDY